MKLTGVETNEIILKEIGQRIKDIRISMSLTQEELALKAGVSIRTVVRLEAGDNIKLESFFNILRVLNCIQNVELLMPEQQITPEMIFNKEQKRQRASSKQKKENKSSWKWGDEK